MAHNAQQIDFLKTFVKTAEVVMDKFQIEEAADLRSFRISKTLADLYPALKLATAELNREYGFRVKISKDDPKEIFATAEAFYELHQDIMTQAEKNESFNKARFLFNPADDLFPLGVKAAEHEVSSEDEVLKRYWMNRTLSLAKPFTQIMCDEVSSKLRNQLLSAELAEKLLSSLVERKAIKDTSVTEDVRNVFAETAEDYACNLGVEDPKKAVDDLAYRFQEECNWSKKNKAVRKSIEDVIGKFAEIVSKNQPKLCLYANNSEAAWEALDEFDDALSDEGYFELSREIRVSKKLNINMDKKIVPANQSVDQVLVDVGSFAEDMMIEPEFEKGSKEEYWHRYKTQMNITETQNEDIERLLGQMVMIADNELADIQTMIGKLEAKSEDYDSDDDDDDEEEVSYNNATFLLPESDDDKEQKFLILKFADDLLELNGFIKQHYDIELNDTPVDRKVIKGLGADEEWNNFTFSSLNMLFNAFDRNLGENEGVLWPKLDLMEVSPEMVEGFIALPSSLEKRNVLKMFKQGLQKVEVEATNRKLETENIMVADFTAYHVDDFNKLSDDLRLGQETFPEIDDEMLNGLIKDVNSAAVVNYVIPIYGALCSENDRDFMFEEMIVDLEDLSPEAHSYVLAVADQHVNRVIDTHNKVLDEGKFDRELYTDIEDYTYRLDKVDEISLARIYFADAFAAEEHVYLGYTEHKKANQQPKSAVIDVLWRNRFCNN